jgi:glycosyltransferase involved in cell wall biosynthesis
VRVLVDYRPALRFRTGVGEYAHQLIKALLAAFPDGSTRDPIRVTLFSSSWKDRLRPQEHELAAAARVDRRVPVRILNFAWHRLEWPGAERLTGRAFDVTHSFHPLILPSQRAAHVVTIHDLDFLRHPERTRAEIRRDYPALVRSHAHRADRIVVNSHFTGTEVERRLEVAADKITVCLPGAPDWSPRAAPPPDDAYVLFFGTLEPRKNVGTLLDAYETLVTRRRDMPVLVLAGRQTPESRGWLERIGRPPLSRFVRYAGYVDPKDRQILYEGARLLVQPSFDEGFGMPVLEAMTLGVPVVAANRGALPEVVGETGPLVDPDSSEELASAIERLIDDQALWAASAAKGPLRAHHFRWDQSARHLEEAYRLALQHRDERRSA